MSKLTINYSFTTLYNESEEGLYCYIPGFDIHFFATSEEERTTIANAMTHSFFDFWVKEQGQKSFLLHLNRIGFRTQNHNFAMQSLLNSRNIKKTKFKLLRDNIPSEYASAQKFNVEADFAVAV
ncbi:hypothetical protein E6A44_003035 [Pedobacter ureilyticus]|uniref:Uncharacterized protein n=1 Tax=Pedobacter ureilyticus TaxID=1393051 RepID=A0ABW9J3S7_9SPHI